MEGSNHRSLHTRAGPLRTGVISLQEQEGLTPAEIYNRAFDREDGAVPIDVVSDTSSSSSEVGAGLRENTTSELPVDPVADHYLRLHAHRDSLKQVQVKGDQDTDKANTSQPQSSLSLTPSSSW